MIHLPRICAGGHGFEMSRLSTLLEEFSGLASFWVGLLFLFISGQMAFDVRGAAGWIPVIGIGGWSIALLAASRRGGRSIVLFRILSTIVLVVGTILAAILLP